MFTRVANSLQSETGEEANASSTSEAPTEVTLELTTA